jgi:hypothetical protein
MYSQVPSQAHSHANTTDDTRNLIVLGRAENKASAKYGGLRPLTSQYARIFEPDTIAECDCGHCRRTLSVARNVGVGRCGRGINRTRCRIQREADDKGGRISVGMHIIEWDGEHSTSPNFLLMLGGPVSSWIGLG